MGTRISNLSHGEEITPALVNRLIDGVNRNRISSPDHLVQQTSGGTDISNIQQAEEVPSEDEILKSEIQPFAVLEDYVPRRIIGGGGTQSPPDAAASTIESITGYFLNDPDETPVEFFPAQQTDRTPGNLYPAQGVCRAGTSYHEATRGWAQWIEHAYQDYSGEWVGQWQIVALYGSVTVEARDCGPYQIIGSDAVAGTFAVAENLIGFLKAGDILRAEGCTIANNRDYTVAEVIWTAPNTTILVAEAVGANGEATGTIGRVVRSGETFYADLWWANDAGTALEDSQYDVDVHNLTDVRITAGSPLTLYFDRSEFRWHVQDVRLPAIFTGYLVGTFAAAPDHVVPQNTNYLVYWTKNLLVGGDLTHFTPDFDIAIETTGYYDVSVMWSLFPEVGQSIECQVDLELDLTSFFRKNISINSAGAWNCCTSVITRHTFRATAGQELQVRITELNNNDLRLRGHAAAGNQRCEISVHRLRH